MKLLDNLAYYKMNYLIRERPLDINIETINWCPMKCVFCCNRIFNRPQKIMSLRLFSKICKDYNKTGGGVLGIGAMQSDFLADPLLMKRIDILKEYKRKFYIYSTTPLISLKKYNDTEVKAILSTFSLLQISVEGLNREDYLKMAGVDAFEIFQEQIKRVYNIIQKYGLKIKIHLYFRTYNIKKMRREKYYKELVNMFIERNVRQSFFSWFGSIKQEDLPKGSKLIYRNNSKKKENCNNPHVSLAVIPDGRVVGCGCIDWNATVVIGDMRKQSIREVWQGDKATLFRQGFSQGKIPYICVECGLYSSMKSAYKKAQFLKYRIHGGLVYDIDLWDFKICSRIYDFIRVRL